MKRIRELLPDLSYKEVDPREDPDYAAKFNIKHAPGIVIDGTIEFVGIPRERMLLERIKQLQSSPKAREPQKGGSSND